MGVRRYCCSSPDCTHSRFLCQTCKSRACSSCGLKATEQWIAESSTSCPTATGNISPSPCRTCCGRSSVTTGRCSTTSSAAPPAPCSRHARNLGIEVGISGRCIPTDGSLISTRISTFPSPAAVLKSSTAPGATCSLKDGRLKTSGGGPLFVCCVPAMIPQSRHAAGTSDISATRSSGSAT